MIELHCRKMKCVLTIHAWLVGFQRPYEQLHICSSGGSLILVGLRILGIMGVVITLPTTLTSVLQTLNTILKITLVKLR